MNFQKSPLSAGLYFVGVPIGAARDITLRALDVLASVDVLVAEDTRSLRKLLDIHGVPLEGRRVISLHDHSSQGRVDGLVDMVRGGASMAYASEAGMPAIADPGFELARAMHEAGLPVTSAPGPSAGVTALTLAGLPTDRHYFLGFLPSSTSARQDALQDAAEVPATLIVYESPKRVAACLADMVTCLGAVREAALCRELTKKFEEVVRGTLADIADHVARHPPKGEIVLLVDRARSGGVKEVDLEDATRAALEAHSVRDAADLVAKAHNVPRKKVYQLALSIAARAKDDTE